MRATMNEVSERDRQTNKKKQKRTVTQNYFMGAICCFEAVCPY